MPPLRAVCPNKSQYYDVIQVDWLKPFVWRWVCRCCERTWNWQRVQTNQLKTWRLRRLRRDRWKWPTLDISTAPRLVESSFLRQVELECDPGAGRSWSSLSRLQTHMSLIVCCNNMLPFFLSHSYHSMGHMRASVCLSVCLSSRILAVLFPYRFSRKAAWR